MEQQPGSHRNFNKPKNLNYWQLNSVFINKNKFKFSSHSNWEWKAAVKGNLEEIF